MLIFGWTQQIPSGFGRDRTQSRDDPPLIGDVRENTPKPKYKKPRIMFPPALRIMAVNSKSCKCSCISPITPQATSLWGISSHHQPSSPGKTRHTQTGPDVIKCR